MYKLTALCAALAVLIGTSLEAEAQNKRGKRGFQRGNANQTQHLGGFPFKPPKWKHPGPAPKPQPRPRPKPAPRVDGLTFKNNTGKEIVMYVYKPNDDARTFTWKDIRVPPRGTVSWPQADDRYRQLWLKGMEIGSVFVVAPERKLPSTGVVTINQNRLGYSRR